MKKLTYIILLAFFSLTLSTVALSDVLDTNKSAPPAPPSSFSGLITEGYQWDHDGNEFEITAIPVSYVRKLYATIAELQKENAHIRLGNIHLVLKLKKLEDVEARNIELEKSNIELEKSRIVTAWPTEGWVFYEPFGWVYFNNEAFPYFWVTQPKFERQFSMTAADIGLHSTDAAYSFKAGLSGWCFLDTSSDNVLVYCFDKSRWYTF